MMKLFRDFQIESTVESQVKLNRNRDYLKSIPKFSFELARDLNPDVKELLDLIKLRVAV